MTRSPDSVTRDIIAGCWDDKMGGCLSLRRPADMSGPTFSHYSLTSQSDNLDLYPGFRYAETETSTQGTVDDSQTVWRRSSVPLLHSWEAISR